MIELPPPDVHDLSGTAFVGWSASAMRSYAQAAVLAERQACWDAINAHIKEGVLQGNGCDDQAQRNGMILASNIIANRIAAIRSQEG